MSIMIVSAKKWIGQKIDWYRQLCVVSAALSQPSHSFDKKDRKQSKAMQWCRNPFITASMLPSIETWWRVGHETCAFTCDFCDCTLETIQVSNDAAVFELWPFRIVSIFPLNSSITKARERQLENITPVQKKIDPLKWWQNTRKTEDDIAETWKLGTSTTII